jgi:hypothetical protein
MAKRKVYHITPSHEGGWNVKPEGVHRNIQHTKTKQEALNYARQLAKQTQPSQIKVHNRTGRIQTEYTYGNDPRKSKG